MNPRDLIVAPVRRPADGGLVPVAGLVLLVLLLPLGLGPAGCGARPLGDPVAELNAPGALPGRQERAIEAIVLERPADPTAIDALADVIGRPGEAPEVRVAAARALDELDPVRLRRTLRVELPNLSAWRGLEALCDLIAESGWTELTPALVSSWSRPIPGFEAPEAERPEALALARLYGADEVLPTVIDVLMDTDGSMNAALRARAWELMHRLGERERLADLVVERAEASGRPDAMMRDLADGVRELGILPRNREEILWLRTLREPGRAAFWTEAASALAELPAGRQLELELRDVPIVVAARRHRPDLLAATVAELEASLTERLRGVEAVSRIDTGSSRPADRLRDWRGRLTWGDLAAMHLALAATEGAPLREHLFDFAERDRADRGTEYGGVLALDDRGRFELLEFPPRMRVSDSRFTATQEMLDVAYTGLFHLHLHAQEHRNRDYAGPGYGDLQYAEAMRANCLVLTFVREDRMNLDFYRHGRVSVDLGSVRRP